VDDTGQPKVLDFGVARIVDTDVHNTRQTDVGKLVGTLAYISPEQLLADPLALDTRSDVYALGVILYEAACWKTPLSCQPQITRGGESDSGRGSGAPEFHSSRLSR